MAQVKQKRSSTTLPMLIGAIGFGIVAALLSVLYLKAREREILESLKGPDERRVEVVVATSDLPRGTLVVPPNFAVREIPVTFVHSDVVYPQEFERYQGRSLTADLASGKPLLKSFLDETYPRDFSDTIPAGRRAITVTVDEVNSVAGLIRPGNRIDVFVSISYKLSGFNPEFVSVGLYRELPPDLDLPGVSRDRARSLFNQVPEDQKAEMLAKLSPGDVIVPVLQNVQVMATDQLVYADSLERQRVEFFGPDTSFSSVTLNVTPEQAALVSMAQSKGTLLATLRNRRDDGASGFTMVSANNLFDNAAKLAAAEQERQSRVTVVAGTDANGNLVDAEGKRLMSRDQLVASGFTVTADGQILDRTGNPVEASDLVIAPDGTVITRQKLAAAGLTVNQSGQIVDSNGQIVSAADIVVAADGTVVTRSQLAASGLVVNEDGQIVDKNGKIVTRDDMIVASDGKILSRQQLAAAGYSVNAAGEVVDKDGKVVDVNTLHVAADGSVLTREQLAAAGLSTNERGELVDRNGKVVAASDVIVASDGSVMTRSQLAAAGLSIDESGKVVDANGNTVDTGELVTGPGGTVLSRSQLKSAGLQVNDKGQIVDSTGKVVSAAELAQVAKNVPIAGTAGGVFDMIIGGASKDGVAKSNRVPVEAEE